jgi:hypothetical protein
MSVSRLLTLLACVAGACALSAPAALASAPANGQGVVLSLSGHTVRLVDKAHRVSGVHVRSTHGLRRGDVVRVRRGKAHVSGHARRVSFLGRVVRSSRRGAVVRLGDGSTFKLAGARKRRRRSAHAAANVTIDVQGLAPGQALLITIATSEQGDVAVTIKLLPASTDIGGDDGDQGGSGDQGTCGDDETADTGDDDTADTGDDDTCAGDPGDESIDEVDGTVTALADDGSSLTLAPDDGSAEESYPIDDPSLLDGIAIGDEVAVSLDADGVVIDVELLDFSDDDPGAGDDGGGDA